MDGDPLIMRTRNQKCYDQAANLPGGLTVESVVVSEAGTCTVSTRHPARQMVRVQNRTLFRFAVVIESRCETSGLKFDSGDVEWNERVEVSPRRASGRFRERVMEAALSCTGASPDESIGVVVRFAPVGFAGAGSSELHLQVDTFI